jgi:hypothetical protein
VRSVQGKETVSAACQDWHTCSTRLVWIHAHQDILKIKQLMNAKAVPLTAWPALIMLINVHHVVKGFFFLWISV